MDGTALRSGPTAHDAESLGWLMARLDHELGDRPEQERAQLDRARRQRASMQERG